ncbi:MAG TPA: OmpA family protein [Burkholderiales bacterium]|nr:OmpA family protein [Burkholderiales bacterium]
MTASFAKFALAVLFMLATCEAQALSCRKPTFRSFVYFSFDSIVISPKAAADLDQLLAEIENINLEVIVAVGYTDHVGPRSYNQILAKRRAEAVKAYLVSHGVEPNRVYAGGPEIQNLPSNGPQSEEDAKGRMVDVAMVGSYRHLMPGSCNPAPKEAQGSN